MRRTALGVAMVVSVTIASVFVGCGRHDESIIEMARASGAARIVYIYVSSNPPGPGDTVEGVLGRMPVASGSDVVRVQKDGGSPLRFGLTGAVIHVNTNAAKWRECGKLPTNSVAVYITYMRGSQPRLVVCDFIGGIAIDDPKVFATWFDSADDYLN